MKARRFLFGVALVAAATPAPFWASRPEIYKKMRDDRYIAVSAKSEAEGKQKHLHVLSGGFIHAPLNVSHKYVTDFNSYSKHVPYMEESSYDSKTGNLFVHGAILGYHVRMTMHLDDVQTEKGHQIQWKTISGNFVGMKGTISENRADEDHTEIALQGDYTGESLNIPGFILNWGLEFAAQRASAAMRTYIEEEWSKAAKKH